MRARSVGKTQLSITTQGNAGPSEAGPESEVDFVEIESNFSAACEAPTKRNNVEATARRREISFFMSPARIADCSPARYRAVYLCGGIGLPF
jgi:hypothetical protein